MGTEVFGESKRGFVVNDHEFLALRAVLTVSSVSSGEVGQVLSGSVSRLRVRVFRENLLQYRLASGDVMNPMQQQFNQAELSSQKLLTRTFGGGNDLLQQFHSSGEVFEVVGLDFGLEQVAF